MTIWTLSRWMGVLCASLVLGACSSPTTTPDAAHPDVVARDAREGGVTMDAALDSGLDGGPGCRTDQVLCGTQCVSATDPAFGCGVASCAPCAVMNATATCTGGACAVGACATGFGDCDMAAGNGCETDVTTATANCGACGTVCPTGQSCVAGACHPSITCTGTQVDCGGVCTDTQTSGGNCGACGHACATGAACTAGACGCAGGQVDCGGGMCRDTQTDVNNCGGCGTVCPSGQTCAAGACACAAGQKLCAGACVSATDPAFGCGGTACGACAVAHATAACVAGACGVGTCAANFADCNASAADGCEANTQADLINCGACGHACTAGQTCTAGACVVAAGCPIAGQISCSGVCTSTQTDGANCGACGTACPAGTACTAGSCHCPAGQALCGGACVDTQTSAANCGACGAACPATATCVAGACACAAGQSLCAGACHDTQTDSANCGACGHACTGGTSCTAGSCQCPTGQTLCSGVCSNAMTDTANCGSCGHACGAGQVCAGGACGCAAGQKLCGAACVATTDPTHGCASAACGACVEANATAVCATGACAVGACNANYADCDMAAGNGCEASLQTDLMNCGSCGHACGAGLTCMAGACVTAMGCPVVGQTNCAGTCTSTQTDNANCGACGTVCTASRTCVAGVCTCGAGLTFCSGACVPTQTDNANCGGCGMVCAGGRTCAAGACVCPAGQTFCGGACVNTSTSNTYCSPSASMTCGAPCTGGTTCTAGACTCPAGQVLCGGVCTNTQTNSSNCGACGTVCTGGRSCSAGACACPSGQTFCGGACVDTGTSTTYCSPPAGMLCGGACLPGQTCAAGVCACPTGQRVCGGACVNTLTNSNDCTTAPAPSCGVVCGGGTPVCNAGTCSAAPPPNDHRAGAIVIPIDPAIPSQTFSSNTATATPDTSPPAGCIPSCSASTKDVFYTFTLTQPEYVYVDTNTTPFDTVVYLQDSTGANLATPTPASMAHCNDDALLCSLTNFNSLLVDSLAPGTYYLVLSGCGTTDGGVATLHFQHLPAASVGTPTPISLTQGVTNSYPFTDTGTGNVTEPCTTSSGSETGFWFVGCPGVAAVPLVASTCPAGTPLDTVVDVRTATGGVNACNDDFCANSSEVFTTVPSGAGLTVVYADTYNPVDSGPSTLFTTFGTCAAPTTFCGGRCSNTATDNNNCGSCGTVCGTGTTCVTSLCRPVNDNRANAITLTPSMSGEVTVAGSTLNATTDGPGAACACLATNVWYTFTAPATAFYYVDTAGSAIDTGMYMTNAAGATLPAQFGWGYTTADMCNDDASCSAGGFTSTLQSRMGMYLSAGTVVYLSVGNCSAMGNFTLHLQLLNPPTRSDYIAPISGTGTDLGTVSGVTNNSSTCGGSTFGEVYTAFMTCGGSTSGWIFSTCASDGGTYQRQVGTTLYDPVMYLFGAQSGAQYICNDDGTSAGATNCQGTGGDSANYGSRLVPGGVTSLQRGLNAVYVDSNSGNPASGSMTYSFAYTIPH